MKWGTRGMLFIVLNCRFALGAGLLLTSCAAKEPAEPSTDVSATGEATADRGRSGELSNSGSNTGDNLTTSEGASSDAESVDMPTDVGAPTDDSTHTQTTAGEGASSGIEATTATASQDPPEFDLQIDPYGNNPLVAVVNLRGLQSSDVQGVEVVVVGQDGGADFARSYASTATDVVDVSDLDFLEPGYQVPVLGLYADRESQVRIHVETLTRGPLDLTLTIATQLTKPEQEPWVPNIDVHTAVVADMERGWTVAEISTEPNPSPDIVFVNWTRTIAFDEVGAVRWALVPDLPLGETFTVRRSITGQFWTGSLDTIIEVNKFGRILRTLQLPEHELTHDMLQIGAAPDGGELAEGASSAYQGNLLALASKNGAATIDDHILEIDRESGEVLNDWDLTTVLDANRTTYLDAQSWAASPGDWLHTNGLTYSAADESLIVSGRHQGVAKFQRDGTLTWLLAPHKGWSAPQSAQLLTAVDAMGDPYPEEVQQGNEPAGDSAAPEFDWPFGQHAPALLPSGDLVVFDNGSVRNWGAGCGGFSRIAIYRIDEAAMTVRQLGQQVFERAKSSCFVSNVDPLPLTGNLFAQPGWPVDGNTVTAREYKTQVASDGSVSVGPLVFDATIDMSVVDTTQAYVYSYRGHRWTF